MEQGCALTTKVSKPSVVHFHTVLGIGTKKILTEIEHFWVSEYFCKYNLHSSIRHFEVLILQRFIFILYIDCCLLLDISILFEARPCSLDVVVLQKKNYSHDVMSIISIFDIYSLIFIFTKTEFSFFSYLLIGIFDFLSLIIIIIIIVLLREVT